jgi:PAS domain S-box-containing protein
MRSDQPLVGGAERALPLALVIGGLMLSVAAFFALNLRETRLAEQATEIAFYSQANAYISAIRQESAKRPQAVRALKAFFDSSETVTRQEFRTFTTILLEANPSIQALEWVPRVVHSERTRYEAKARGFVSGFHITERREDGVLIPATERAEYLPVYFVEPFTDNELALGFDLASESVRREALQRARDTAGLATSGPVTLVQETGHQLSRVMYLPIYRKGVPLTSVAERRQNLKGFVVGVCRPGELVGQALAHLSGSSIDLWLMDTTTDPQLLYAHLPQGASDSGPRGLRPPPATGLLLADTLQLGGRQCKVVAAPAPGYFMPSVPYSAWVVLLGGLVITGLLAGYLNVLQCYAGRVLHANRLLDDEVSEHRHTEAALRASETKLRQVLESAADAIIICDERGRILIANGQAERLFGYTRCELLGQPVERLVPEGLHEQHAAERSDYWGHLTPRPMGTGLELFARRKDGTSVPVEISLSPVHAEQGLMVTAIFHDFTARMHTEARLRHLNRTYAVLSRCNIDLARARDEVELLSAFCRTLVEVGGYRFTCVGYAQQDQAKGVRLMAYAGHTDDAFSVIAAGWSDTAVPRSPSGTAIRSAEPVVLRDIEKDPRFPLWRDIALRQGYRSMIALPLRSADQVLGDFSIYSTQRAAFDEEEVELLAELVGDLGFGIQTLRSRAARAQKVRLLREEAEREAQKRLAATLHDGVGQSMQAVNLGLKRLRALTSEGERPTGELLDRLIDDVGGVIAELRSVTQQLRPPFLERMGLPGAIRYWCNVLGERSGIAIHVVSDDDVIQLDKRAKEQCFLIIHEALSNATSHAQATRIDVNLESSGTGWLRARIADNGRGFDPGQSWQAPSGLGLSMMSERAASVGGQVEIHSASGEGTTVSVTVPLTA